MPVAYIALPSMVNRIRSYSFAGEPSPPARGLDEDEATSTIVRAFTTAPSLNRDAAVRHRPFPQRTQE
nr:hypothetical protein [uncultured Bilophila sp.]